MKRFHISSSIANFKENLSKRYSDYGAFRWFSKDPTIFFGAYHVGDYLRIFFHRGRATIFWCGSDILALTPLKALIASKCEHVCENGVEQLALSRFDIFATVHPMLFDDPSKYHVTYERSDRPTVWMTYHKGRENDYGKDRFMRLAMKCPEVNFVAYSGGIPREEFDRRTATHQATIRLNEFDGFSENLAKAALRGQYMYSVIPYPDCESIVSDEELIASLKELRNQNVPHETSYWCEMLSKRVEI